MVTEHPIRRAVTVLRAWLLLFMTMMIWNAFVANPIMLGSWVRPLPFLLLAGMAFVWFLMPWHQVVVIGSTSAMSVAIFLRGLEVFFYGDSIFDLNTRLTASSVWFTISGTVVCMGVLSLLAASRRQAEEWVWKRKEESDVPHHLRQ